MTPINRTPLRELVSAAHLVRAILLVAALLGLAAGSVVLASVVVKEDPPLGLPSAQDDGTGTAPSDFFLGPDVAARHTYVEFRAGTHGTTTITIRVETRAQDRLVKYALDGKLTPDGPVSLRSLAGYPYLASRTDDSSASFDWYPPSIEMSQQEPIVTITQVGRVSATQMIHGPFDLLIQYPISRLTLTVSTSGYTVSSVAPRSAVLKVTDDALITTDFSGLLRVGFAASSAGADIGTAMSSDSAIPFSLGYFTYTLTSVLWLCVSVIAILVIAHVRTRKKLHSDRFDPNTRESLKSLLLVVGAILLATLAEDLYGLPRTDFAARFVYQFGLSLKDDWTPAAVTIVLLSVARALPDRWTDALPFSRRVATVGAGFLTAVTGCTCSVVLVNAADPLTAGVALTSLVLLGCLAVALTAARHRFLAYVLVVESCVDLSAWQSGAISDLALAPIVNVVAIGLSLTTTIALVALATCRAALRRQLSTGIVLVGFASGLLYALSYWLPALDSVDAPSSFLLVNFFQTSLPLIEALILVVLLIGLSVSGSFSATGFWWVALITMSLLLFHVGYNAYGWPVAYGVGTAMVGSVLLLRYPSSALTEAGGHTLEPVDNSFLNDTRELMTRLRSAHLDADVGTALRKKLTSSDVSLSDVDSLSATVMARLSRPPQAVISRSAGLRWGGGRGPWQRGAYGTLVASSIGLPLSVPVLVNLLMAFNQPAAYNPLSSALSALEAIRFPIFGLVFGFFFPVLRGSSGAAKAIRFAVVLGVSESIGLLVPYHPSDQIGGVVALRLLQVALVSITLGVSFDLRSLRAVGLGFDDLGDLYNRSRFALWSSGVAVTLITAVLTAALSSATAEVLDRIAPTPPSTQQSTSQSSTSR